MDRELKFRVWDKYSGKSPTGGMHYFDAMEICDNGLFFKNSKFDMEQNHNDDKKAIVMQYTGLKDKNGKEIYEGDILKRIVTVPNVDGEGVFIEKVVYGDGGFDTINIANDESGYLREYLFHTVEVIGNIFENPELLKTDTDGTKN